MFEQNRPIPIPTAEQIDRLRNISSDGKGATGGDDPLGPLREAAIREGQRTTGEKPFGVPSGLESLGKLGEVGKQVGEVIGKRVGDVITQGDFGYLDTSIGRQAFEFARSTAIEGIASSDNIAPLLSVGQGVANMLPPQLRNDTTNFVGSLNGQQISYIAGMWSGMNRDERKALLDFALSSHTDRPLGTNLKAISNLSPETRSQVAEFVSSASPEQQQLIGKMAGVNPAHVEGATALAARLSPEQAQMFGDLADKMQGGQFGQKQLALAALNLPEDQRIELAGVISTASPQERALISDLTGFKQSELPAGAAFLASVTPEQAAALTNVSRQLDLSQDRSLVGLAGMAGGMSQGERTAIANTVANADPEQLAMMSRFSGMSEEKLTAAGQFLRDTTPEQAAQMKEFFGSLSSEDRESVSKFFASKQNLGDRLKLVSEIGIQNSLDAYQLQRTLSLDQKEAFAVLSKPESGEIA